MSGQELTLPISEVDSLSLGELRQTHVPVGVFDMNQLMPGADIGGFISLGFFKDTAFTIEDQRKILTVETNATLEKIKSTGATVPIVVDQQGVSVSIHMPPILPNGKKISAAVDSGSQALILHDRYMSDLKIQPDDKDVKRKQGKDETGHLFDRYFTKLKGPVQLPGYPNMNVDSINVMFQKIIYDGLVGQNFLRQFTITYDLKSSEIIFRKP